MESVEHVEEVRWGNGEGTDLALKPEQGVWSLMEVWGEASEWIIWFLLQKYHLAAQDE